MAHPLKVGREPHLLASVIHTSGASSPIIRVFAPAGPRVPTPKQTVTAPDTHPPGVQASKKEDEGGKILISIINFSSRQTSVPQHSDKSGSLLYATFKAQLGQVEYVYLTIPNLDLRSWFSPRCNEVERPSKRQYV